MKKQDGTLQAYNCQAESTRDQTIAPDDVLQKYYTIDDLGPLLKQIKSSPLIRGGLKGANLYRPHRSASSVP